MTSRLDQAIAAQRQALRSLAVVLGRAELHRDDLPGDVVDMLMEAGFPEESEADTALLNAIDPEGADAEPGPGVCRGCGGNFSHALTDGQCDECRGNEASS